MYEVIGVGKSEFTPKDGGDRIFGLNLYVTEERKGVQGLACERLYINERKLDNFVPVVGDVIDVFWNRYGKVERLVLAKA